jgi:hypothetical protein
MWQIPNAIRKPWLWAVATAVAIAAAQPGQRYPAHWWTPVPEAHPPAWEVLPQAAKPGEVILSKRNELGILSNFAATPFTLRGQRYASVEGFWQMMLYPEGPGDPRAKAPGIAWPHWRQEVAQMTGFEAKDAGQAGTKPESAGDPPIDRRPGSAARPHPGGRSSS